MQNVEDILPPVRELMTLPRDMREKISEEYLIKEGVPPGYAEPRDFLPNIQQTKETLRQEIEKRDRYYDPNRTEQVAFDEDYIDELREELIEIRRLINIMQRARIITND